MSLTLSPPQDRSRVEGVAPSGFGKAMAELIAVQGRLAEEHAQEVSRLQSANASLISQLSDLRARMDEVTHHYEETAHLALVPSERCDNTEVKHVDDADASSSSESIFPLDLDNATKAQGNYTHAPDAADLPMLREAPLSCADVVLDDVPDELPCNLGSDDCSEDAEEASECEQSEATNEGYPSLASLPSLGGADMSIQPSAVSSQWSVKGERRAHRLRTNLIARLWPVWVLDESDAIVPRWSQTSVETFSTKPSEQKSIIKALKRGSSKQSLTMKRSLSLETRTVRRSCIVHPQSRFKVMIDLVGMLIMSYDFIMTPLMFFNLPESDFTSLMEWATRIFWTVDMWLIFHTAIYQKGELVRKFRPIAQNYIKTMFFPDLVIVVAEWLAYILDSTSQSGRSLENVYFLRILKVLRFAKVLRIFKFERKVHGFSAQLNSTFLVLWLRPMILVFFLLVFNHTLACLWYGIGTSSQGWTEHEAKDESIGYMYMTALHWAISQLHGNMEVFPQNVQERLFMCSNAMVALILYSTFLSSITNAMMEIRALQAELHERKSKLRACLARRHISTELTMRIKQQVEYISSAKTELDAEATILSSLPKDLLMDLYEESRGPIVVRQMFFAMLGLRGPRIIRQLCHDSMSEASHLPDNIVFSAGDACPCMYFVTNGELLYELRANVSRVGFRGSIPLSVSGGSASTPVQHIGSASNPAQHRFSENSSRVKWQQSESTSMSRAESLEHKGACQPVRSGYWLSEAALWMTWEYCGALTASTPALLLMVNAVSFATVLKQFHFAHVNSKRYARRFIDRMVQQFCLTDILKEDDEEWLAESCEM